MSNLPSSYSRGTQVGAASPPSAPEGRFHPPHGSSLQPPGASDSRTSALAAIALILALASVYGTFFADRPLSPVQREQLAGIANDLRALQDREIRMTAPLQTTVYINKSYPIKDMFPETFEIPLEFFIPIDTQMIAVSTTGQPVAFRIQENVPIKARITINSGKAFGSSSVQISKELPLETTWSSAIRVRAAYGQDLNNIIDRLDALAGVPSSSGSE